MPTDCDFLLDSEIDDDDMGGWVAFARALRNHGSTGEVTGVSRSDYGTRYSVEGSIETPDGRNPRIRTVWIVDSERDAPRLITAHPLRKRDAWRT